MNVIIVGGGKVGTYLASMLIAGNHKVKLIEARSEEIIRLRKELLPETVFYGSGADPTMLETAGVQNADVVAAVTGSDETNLVVTSLARFEFDVPRVIARVNNPKNAWLFTPAMGVDVALNQADLMANLIAEEMSMGDMLTLLKLRKGQYSLVVEKVDAGSPALGKPLGELRLPEECVLMAVIRKGDLLLPRPDVVFQIADEVFALVHFSRVKDLAQALERPE